MVERDSREGVSLSEKVHCGGPRGRAPLLGTLDYEQKALEMGISLCGGSGGQPGVGSSTGVFEIWLKGALEVGRLSLYGSSVKGTWREGSIAGYPRGWVEKTLDMGISFHRDPLGNLEGAHLPGTLTDG
jgi:hypothetical protein